MAKLTKVENVRMTLALLKAHGIKHVVVSPGGTNIPLVQGLQQDSFFHCYSVVDERSAMYFAIGLYLQLGEPIATTCTSAQATRNYIPGLTEAYYKHTPILAITHSKHYRFTHQDYMQAPNQVSLPEDSVKKSYALPYIATSDDRMQCVRMINEAILELTHHNSGPVQLNIPILDSERLSFVETELPKVRVIKRYLPNQEWDITFKDKRVMILAGEHIEYTEKERKVLEEFVETHNAILYTNHLSNVHAKNEIQGNLLVTSMSKQLFDDQYAPDILITIGGQTGDYSIFGKLYNNSNCEHWRISTDGDVVDTYDKLTKVFQCDILTYFNRVNSLDVTSDNSYYSEWAQAMVSLNTDEIELPLSNIYVAQQLHKIIPDGSTINFSIVNSLRSWFFFSLDKTINCFSPVAAFGIDGGMSMALGQAYNSKKLSFFITGDLAFFYDMNCLGIRGLGKNIRIVLINNNKGAEFTVFGDLKDIDSNTYISAYGHNGSAEGWCQANDFKYIRATTKDDIKAYAEQFVLDDGQSKVLEVVTSDENEEIALKEIITTNFKRKKDDSLKGHIKDILGDNVVSIIRGIIGR